MENIFEHLEAVFVERRSEVFNKNMDYRRYMEKEEELFIKFKGSLSKEQNKLFEEYLAADMDTQTLIESLSYKQGMIDLLDFLKSIGYDEKS